MWTHPVSHCGDWARQHCFSGLSRGSQLYWVAVCAHTTSLVCLKTLLNPADRHLHPPYSLRPPCSHPRLPRCWDGMLCRWLITRVALGGDEGGTLKQKWQLSLPGCKTGPSPQCATSAGVTNRNDVTTLQSVNPGKMTVLLLLFFHYCALPLHGANASLQRG